MTRFQKTLRQLEEQHRYRSLNLPCGIDLTSNDYLGMASHSDLQATAIKALENGLDTGAAGSRLLRGHTQAHQDLENFAADYFKTDKTLFLSSGFQANYALLTTLPDRSDIVLYDSLIHASMRDGLAANHSKHYKFAHNDMNALEDLLKRHRNKTKQMWIAVESLYSMDGDLAPLSKLYDLARKFNAMLIVDEAHATGILGKNGKGACWDMITKRGYERLITIHTCGKAIGVAGGLICGSSEIIDYMINKARPFIYSTAPMPLQALLVQKSLDILASKDGQTRRKKLQTLCAKAKTLFGGHGTHILPIMLGEEKKTIDIAHTLQKQGYDIRAIRPPTVPKGTARLRLSLSSNLKTDILQSFSNALQSCMQHTGKNE